jgi:hypothetical protein
MDPSPVVPGGEDCRTHDAPEFVVPMMLDPVASSLPTASQMVLLAHEMAPTFMRGK